MLVLCVFSACSFNSKDNTVYPEVIEVLEELRKYPALDNLDLFSDAAREGFEYTGDGLGGEYIVVDVSNEMHLCEVLVQFARSGKHYSVLVDRNRARADAIHLISDAKQELK